MLPGIGNATVSVISGLLTRRICLSLSVLRGDHRLLAEASLRSGGSHPDGLRGSGDPLFQAQGGRDGAAAVGRHLQAAR